MVELTAPVALTDEQKYNIKNQKIRQYLHEVEQDLHISLEEIHKALDKAAGEIDQIIEELRGLGLVEEDLDKTSTRVQGNLEKFGHWFDKLSGLGVAGMKDFDISKVTTDLNDILSYFEKFGHTLFSLMRTINTNLTGTEKTSKKIEKALTELSKIQDKIYGKIDVDLQVRNEGNTTTLSIKQMEDKIADIRGRQHLFLNRGLIPIEQTEGNQLLEQLQIAKEEKEIIQTLDIIVPLQTFKSKFERLERTLTVLGFELQREKIEIDAFDRQLNVVRTRLQQFEMKKNLKTIVDEILKLLAYVQGNTEPYGDQKDIKTESHRVLDIIMAFKPFCEGIKKDDIKRLRELTVLYLAHMRGSQYRT